MYLLQVYYAKVKEDVPVGTVIATVRAHDLDSEEFGSVRYFVAEQDNFRRVSTLFHVNPFSGDVSLLQELDREEYQR